MDNFLSNMRLESFQRCRQQKIEEARVLISSNKRDEIDHFFAVDALGLDRRFADTLDEDERQIIVQIWFRFEFKKEEGHPDSVLGRTPCAPRRIRYVT